MENIPLVFGSILLPAARSIKTLSGASRHTKKNIRKSVRGFFSDMYSNLPTCFGDIPRLCNAKVCSRLFGKSIKIHPRREQSVSFKRSSYN